MSMTMPGPRLAATGAAFLLRRLLAVAFAAAAASPATAQTVPGQQVVKPPVAQLWMDVATHTMPSMPTLPAGGFGMGAGGGSNAFGHTRGMMPGRFVDIALHTQRKPAGTEGVQTMPAAAGLPPSVPLLPPQREAARPPGTAGDDPTQMEMPRGRILLYWGCGEELRPGQPRVLDFSRAKPEEWGQFMQGRAPRERGAVDRPGNALWPNERDRRNFGADASLAGEHVVAGDGVPAGLKFALGPAQDFMPALALAQSGSPADVVRLSWPPLAHAQAYFINAMGGGETADGATEMVLWSSAEVPDPGMALIDYASPANVAQWLKERVLLAPATTACALPKGIFAKTQGAMLRMIAYGPELNLAHPPRPTDPKIAWEPEWAVRVRTRSTAMTPLGESAGRGGGRARAPVASPTGAAPAPAVAARPDCPPPGAGPTAAQAGADVGGAAIGGGFGRIVGGAVGGLLGALGGKSEEKKEAPADCPK